MALSTGSPRPAIVFFSGLELENPVTDNNGHESKDESKLETELIMSLR